jgi:hypothetical protein
MGSADEDVVLVDDGERPSTSSEEGGRAIEEGAIGVEATLGCSSGGSEDPVEGL